MNEKFEMVAKTFQGLEKVLADELTALGAENVAEGTRMVSFDGDKELMYKANFCCRTALRILKPFYKFRATDADSLYDEVKKFNWESVLTPESTFAIDSTVYSDEFRHSKFVTYRVKDAIVDYFREKCDKRPSIRIEGADILINVHISGDEVTISLDSSGEPLYRRGYRVAQNDAPINEVLAAGIILLSGWKGDSNFVDPMCGSGTFLIEAALIAAGIYPGVYRKGFAFERWSDFDADLLENIYNDDSNEREFNHKIYGYDIAPKAIAITKANIKSASVGKYIEVEQRSIEDAETAPEKGVLITNPPYGERIAVEDMEGLYHTIGEKLKKVYRGYDAWVIGYKKELFDAIGLKPSVRYPLFNGSLECELREYVIFDGSYDDLRKEGGSIKNDEFRASERGPRRRFEETFKKDGERSERRERRSFRKDGERDERRGGFRKDGERRSFRRNDDERGERRGGFRKDGERRSFRRNDDEREERRGGFRKDGERRERRGFRRDFDGDDESRGFERRGSHSRVPKFREPRLGKENEREIYHGRRNGWKRRDAENRSNDNND